MSIDDALSRLSNISSEEPVYNIDELLNQASFSGISSSAQEALLNRINEVQAEKVSKEQLSNLKVPELRETAKQLDIEAKGMKKKELVNAVHQKLEDNYLNEEKEKKLSMGENLIMKKLVTELLKELEEQNFTIYNFSPEEMQVVLDFIKTNIIDA